MARSKVDLPTCRAPVNRRQGKKAECLWMVSTILRVRYGGGVGMRCFTVILHPQPPFVKQILHFFPAYPVFQEQHS